MPTASSCSMKAGSSRKAATASSWRANRSTPGSPSCSSPLRQLELDAAVAGFRLFSVAGINRLKLAEAGRHQMLGIDPLVDQIFDDGDGAPRRQLPVRLEGG